MCLVEGKDFEIFVLPPVDKETQVSKVLISVRIPQEIFNKTAEEIELGCTLQLTNTTTFMKSPFKLNCKDRFIMFDATERVEITEEFLSKEIDFDYFVTPVLSLTCALAN